MTTESPASTWSEALAARRQTCTDHCAGCGEHFHGLRAFDAHRQGGYCQPPEAVVYQKGIHAGEPMLQQWTTEGCCDKERGCWKNGKRDHWLEGVVVWQMAVDDAQREALQGLQRKKSDALQLALKGQV